MARHGMAMTLVALLCAAGAASARPLRLLQGADSGINVQYVPQGAGCDGLAVVVNGYENSNPTYPSGPTITGQVQLLNPRQYGIPVDSILVEVRGSDGQHYSGPAMCTSGGSGTFVPSNPQPYTYGISYCSYSIQPYPPGTLFGPPAATSEAHSSSSAAGGGAASQSSSSAAGGGLVQYIPSGPVPAPQLQWTVTAVATIGMTNAQCSSAPAPVNIVGAASSQGASSGVGAAGGASSQSASSGTTGVGGASSQSASTGTSSGGAASSGASSQASGRHLLAAAGELASSQP